MQARKLRFGDYEVDFELQELRKHGATVALEHKPFHLLELLLRNPGQLVTRKELCAHLWPDSYVNFQRGLNSAVNSLRQALGESSRECHFIETRPGIGYRFIAPVEVINEKNTEAYQDYLRGRYLLDRMSEEDIHKALGYFHAAAADETCSSLAYAGIADAYCQLALIGSVSSPTHARAFAALSLRSNPDSPQAQVAAARVKYLFDWDWNGARAASDRALELDAHSVSAHTLTASLACTLGDHATALASSRRALESDPLSFPANLQLAACLYACRDFQSAADHCWQMLSLWPDFAPAQMLLALAYEKLEMYEESIVEFQNARLSSACRIPALSGLSAVCALAGLHTQSELAHRELTTESTTRHVSTYWHAVICVARQQTSQALDFLETSLQQRDPTLLWLPSDARFDHLRHSPRLQKLCQTVF